jgi:hypothetical protein
MDFPIVSDYNFPAASQPVITETASLTAPTAVGYARDQISNTTQIFQEQVSISYAAMSNYGRLSGLNTANVDDNVISEKDFQIANALTKISRDIEYTCLNGVYQQCSSSAVAGKSRGMVALCATGTTVPCAAASLTKTLVDQLLRTMYANGAIFKTMVIWVNAFQKQAISSLYSYAPMDRNIGGVNLKQLETDFGSIAIAMDRFMPTDTVLVAEMSAIQPVFQPVPEKGNFFYETLAKTGASENGQLYGQFGIDHGANQLHGTLTGLATS